MQSRLYAFSLLILFANAMEDETLQELLALVHSICQKKLDVPEELISRAQKGDFDPDQRLKCYIKCIMEESALMDDDGFLDPDGVINLFPESVQAQATPGVKKCDTQIGVDFCDNAWLTFKCYYKEGPDIYFLA